MMIQGRRPTSPGGSSENVEEDEAAEEDLHDLHIDVKDQPQRRDGSSELGNAVNEEEVDEVEGW